MIYRNYLHQSTDMKFYSKTSLRGVHQLAQCIYLNQRGVEAALERDNFMTAEDAKNWGLIDEIVEKRADASDE